MKCYVWPATSVQTHRWVLREAHVKTENSLSHVLYFPLPQPLPSLSLVRHAVQTYGNHQSPPGKHTNGGAEPGFHAKSLRCVRGFGCLRVWDLTHRQLVCHMGLGLPSRVQSFKSCQHKNSHGNEIRRLQVSDWLQSAAAMRSGHIVNYFKCSPSMIWPGRCHLKQALKVIWKWDGLTFGAKLPEFSFQCCSRCSESI